MKGKNNSPEQIVRLLVQAEAQIAAVKDLEKENVRLKRVVADLTLDKEILREALEGK
jgi:cell division protein FtsB